MLFSSHDRSVSKCTIFSWGGWGERLEKETQICKKLDFATNGQLQSLLPVIVSFLQTGTTKNAWEKTHNLIFQSRFQFYCFTTDERSGRVTEKSDRDRTKHHKFYILRALQHACACQSSQRRDKLKTQILCKRDLAPERKLKAIETAVVGQSGRERT